MESEKLVEWQMGLVSDAKKSYNNSSNDFISWRWLAAAASTSEAELISSASAASS